MNNSLRDNGHVFLTSRGRAAWSQGLGSHTQLNLLPKSLYQMQRLREERFCERTNNELANFTNTPAATGIPAESAIYWYRDHQLKAR